ncbi:MAG: hypothetical protein ABSE59_01175 [Opitutaceae bacterium]|jgi:hypothetical protein
MVAESESFGLTTMNLFQRLAANHQLLTLLEERIHHAELRRDYPPRGYYGSDPMVREELRALYVSRARLLQRIQYLKIDLESCFKETFQAALDTARVDHARPAENSDYPSMAQASLGG